jgi:hypothetical protein
VKEINQNNAMKKASLKANYNTSFKGAEKAANPEPITEKNIINDLRNDPKNSLGRSQIKKTKIDSIPFNGGMALNIKKDLETLRNNPTLVAKSDLMFEKNLKHGYDKAAVSQIDFVNEFKK